MKLASIEGIKSIRPHTNADRLEVASVLGWQTVIGKGQFTEGDKVVFVVIDTILPAAPWSEFLTAKSKPGQPVRLRTAKLRGEYSQGLALPMSVIPEHMRNWQIGADVGGELGIKKFEKEIPSVLSGVAKGAFPAHYAARTDEDNGLSNLDVVKMVLASPLITVTQKLDGSSCTIVWQKGTGILDVCSRNLSLAEDDKNSFWKVAKKLDFSPLNQIVDTGETIVLQGELMGPGIQGNQLELSSPELYLFQIRMPNGQYAAYRDMTEYAIDLGCQYVPFVELLSGGTGGATLPSLQRMADELKLENGKPAEGIVVRPYKSLTFGCGRPAGFKIINRNYGE